MERLILKYEDAQKALQTLKDILSEPYSMIVRDATIQRFEYTFEAVWKFFKEYLKDHYGIVSHSPKSCFREMHSVGLLSENETVQCLMMTDHRNDTSHTYKQEVANYIYQHIAQYCKLMETMLTHYKNKK